jgi:hypothetical protein
MKKSIIYALVTVTAVVAITSCNVVDNRLVGHTYIIKPVNSALRLRLLMGLNNITHEYENNHTVKVVTYQGKEPIKSEELRYSFTGTTYRIDDEVYNVSFKDDTVVLSIDSSEYLRLVPVK